MMKTQRLLYITTSFLALCQITQAAEISSTCEELGYTVTVADCLAANGTPLLCPAATGKTNEDKLSICYSQACRSYPLWKKDGKYYHLDKNGYVRVAKENNFFEYVKNGDNAELNYGLEECTTGSTSDARTYYRIKECKEGALFNNDICDEGCAIDKYPYDKHPGDLAGTVESCEDSKGEHYGYTGCNDGWTFNSGQCLLSSCDIKQYPYMGDPNLINNENRGTTKTCRIGGNAYYKYTSCNEGYELKMGVCIKRCALTSCTKTPTTVDGFTYNDWSCTIPSTCRIGDYITYGGNDVGIIFYFKKGENDKNLAMGLTSERKKWGNGIYETEDINTIINTISGTEAKADFDGKIKTKKIIEFTEDYATNFPAAAYCYTYNTNCDVGSFCATGEWYLPAMGELGYMYNNRYLLYNIAGNTFTNDGFWSSSERNTGGQWTFSFKTGQLSTNYKSTNYYVRPVLAF